MVGEGSLMPTFDFTSPDGKTYSVDGPDGATPEQAFQILQGHLGAAPPVSAGGDALKSVGSGLTNAAVGTVGAAGDIRNLGSAATDYIGDKLGVAPDKVQAFKNLASKAGYVLPGVGLVANAPTSRDILNAAPEAVKSASDYQPQTTAGGYLKTGAEFLPALIDPELAAPGALKTAAKLFASRVAAPAVASETAGKLTEGTAAEPYARVGGALLGGAGASKAINSISEARALKAATPTLADVKNEASQTYDALTARNVATPISQSTLDNLASDITTTLNNRGIRPSNASSIHQAIDEIRSPATAGAADVADLVAARQSIKELLGKPDTNKAGAFVALGKIEKEIEAASPGTMSTIKEADKNWSAMRA